MPGQVVLVLQGGGALGAYQLGVYQAMHEAGVEPDWVIGTSIGALNGAIIAGNPPEQRLPRLRAFWEAMERHDIFGSLPPALPMRLRWRRAYQPSLIPTRSRGGILPRRWVWRAHRFIAPTRCAIPWTGWWTWTT